MNAQLLRSFFFAGMFSLLVSCASVTQIPTRAASPQVQTLPDGNEIILATCQLSHPAAVWTEERNGYEVRRTIPFENAENFFIAALSNIPKAVREKIAFQSVETDRSAAFRAATNREGLRNHFRPIEKHIPVWSALSNTNSTAVDGSCRDFFFGDAGLSNRYYLVLHGRIRNSEWVGTGLFQKPTFSIQPELVIYLFNAGGNIVFLRRYDKEYSGLPKETRLSVAAYYATLGQLLADRRSDIASDLATLCEKIEPVKSESLEDAFRKRAPGR